MRPYSNAVVNFLLFVGLFLMLGLAFVVGQSKVDDRPNGSTDGRFHTCDLITEQGVTEHLDAYAARCGTVTP